MLLVRERKGFAIDAFEKTEHLKSNLGQPSFEQAIIWSLTESFLETCCDII